jgi:hypothetical protein
MKNQLNDKALWSLLYIYNSQFKVRFESAIHIENPNALDENGKRPMIHSSSHPLALAPSTYGWGFLRDSCLRTGGGGLLCDMGIFPK